MCYGGFGGGGTAGCFGGGGGMPISGPQTELQGAICLFGVFIEVQEQPNEEVCDDESHRNDECDVDHWAQDPSEEHHLRDHS